jgi:hypothetical protein
MTPPLGPIYDLGTTTVSVVVGVAGAAQNATSVPVAAMPVALPIGFVLDFGAEKFARLSAQASEGDVALTTDPIPTALVHNDAATVTLAPSNSLLSQEFTKLDADDQAAQQTLAELLLNLTSPAYTGRAGQELAYAVVLQVNFQVRHGVSPSLVRSTGNSRSGDTVTYRDRYIDPAAARIVARVTGVRAVRFEPMPVGV